MLSEGVLEELKNNWGDKANAMHCFAPLKFIDGISNWYCYVYALDPWDGDTFLGIVPNDPYSILPRLTQGTLDGLLKAYNREGEYVYPDPEYRPMRVDVLYKKLGGL